MSPYFLNHPWQLRELAQQRQALLATKLVHDRMADVMPLKYLIEREQVDRGLHTGSISDTELALADESKKKSVQKPANTN